VFETPYLRPVFERNSVLELRREVEPMTEVVHSAVGRSSVWLYMPNDLANGFVGHLFQYLMAPTPTHVERNEEFLKRAPDAVLEDWSEFDYVWLPADLEPETAHRFVEVAGVPLTERLFVVTTDESGKTQLRPLSSQL
jgi:hypothetical protein